MTDNTTPDITAALDERLENAVAFANYRITLSNQKQNAKLKLDNSLIYATSGGIFTVDKELISFTSILLIKGKTSAVLVDNSSNPILIQDLVAFNENIVDIYYESTNQYLVEIKELQKARTTKTLVGE